MPRAARTDDKTDHPGLISCPMNRNVLINGKRAAVRGDDHLCQLPPPDGPHSPSTITEGSATVLINGQPAARMDDTVGCEARIMSGASNVLIGG